MSIKASGCSQYGVSKLNSMLEYDSNLGHIFYLTDGELDEDKRAGLQTRNRLLGEIGKCIVRVYETRGSEINQLPCGDVNKYYLRNTSEYPARFAQDRQGRWYVLNCAFDLLEKVNEKHFEINGYCLTNKLEKKVQFHSRNDASVSINCIHFSIFSDRLSEFRITSSVIRDNRHRHRRKNRKSTKGFCFLLLSVH